MKHIFLICMLALLLTGLGLGVPTFSDAAQAPTPGRVRVIESNAQRVVLELVAPPLVKRERSVEGVTYLELDASGAGHTDTAGQPRVPVYGAMVAIPQGAPVKMNLKRDQSQNETLAFTLLPSPQLRAGRDEETNAPRVDGFDYIADSSVYGASALYPSESVSVTDPARWRSQRYVRVQFRPFQFNPVTRELITHTRMRIDLDFGLSQNANSEVVGAAVNEGGFEAIAKNAFINYESARTWRTASRRAPNLPQAERAANATDSYKIEVNADGIYKITCESLTGLYLNAVNLDTVKISFKGNEIAIDVVEDGDKVCETGEYIVFFGIGPTTFPPTPNVYSVTYGGANGKRMVLRDISGGETPSNYVKTLHVEENLEYKTDAPWVEDADHFVWQFVNRATDPDGNGDPNSIDKTVTLSDLAPGFADGVLRVLVQSGGYANPYGIRQSTLYANSVQMYQQDWPFGSSLLAQANINNLVAGSNTIRIQDLHQNPGGLYVYLNYFELDYRALFQAQNDVLRFKYADNGTWRFQVPGFTDANLAAFDITDANNVAKLNASSAPNGGGFNGSFGDTVASPREYLLLASAQFKTPVSITQDTPSTLRSSANGADYILITRGAWKANVQPLAQQRATLGRVMVVDIQDIFDEFNYGISSSQAIRDFFEYAYANWEAPQPSYALLFGNGNIDGGFDEPSIIPVSMKLVDPWIGMIASDHSYVTLDAGSQLPSIAIGRLPAVTAAEVDAIVSKLVNYATLTPLTGWRKKVLFVTDNAYDSNGAPDIAGNFFALSEEVASDPYYFPPLMVADRVYFNPCTNLTLYPYCETLSPSYPTNAQVKTAVKDAIAQGRLIVNYVGHGSTYGWGSPVILAQPDAATLTRAADDPKYPFLMPMTCLEGYFHSGYFMSMSEAFVKQPNGGAIGSYAATGLGIAQGHDFLDRGFFEAVMQSGKPRIGQAIIQSKVELYTDGNGGHLDLLDTMNLLGDPGLLLSLPDEIIPPETQTPTRTLTPSHTPTATSTYDPSGPTWTPTFTPTATPTNTPPPLCTAKPNAPMLLAPKANASSGKQRMRLSWSGAECSDDYRVIVRMDSKKGKKIHKVKQTKTRFRTRELERGHTYYWRIKACNGFGCKASPWRLFSIRE